MDSVIDLACYYALLKVAQVEYGPTLTIWFHVCFIQNLLYQIAKRFKQIHDILTKTIDTKALEAQSDKYLLLLLLL